MGRAEAGDEDREDHHLHCHHHHDRVACGVNGNYHTVELNLGTQDVVLRSPAQEKLKNQISFNLYCRRHHLIIFQHPLINSWSPSSPSPERWSPSPP